MSIQVSTITGKQIFPVISIALPVHPQYPDIKNDLQHINAILKKVKEQVHKEYGHEKADLLSKRMEEAFQSIPQHHLAKSLLIFVTTDKFKVISLPYLVQEKVIVDHSFEVRDLVYELKKLRSYMVVDLSKNAVKHYTCTRSDENFHTGPGVAEMHKSMLKGVSHDVSQFLDGRSFEEKNMHAYVHFVDELISRDGNHKDIPLIIMGDTKLLGYFKKLTSHKERTIFYQEGNFEHAPVEDIRTKAEEILNNQRLKEEEETLISLGNAVGQNRCESGIIQVWRAAAEGRGKLLLVDKDYRQQARLGNDAYTISVDDSDINPMDISRDAVDDIIEMVLKHHGDVQFIENRLPEEYQRITLITRY